MREADGRRRCPFSSKNAWNPSRNSAVVRTAAILGVGSARPAAHLVSIGACVGSTEHAREPEVPASPAPGAGSVSLDVLTPVAPRRRRRRYRAGRIALIAI